MNIRLMIAVVALAWGNASTMEASEVFADEFQTYGTVNNERLRSKWFISSPDPNQIKVMLDDEDRFGKGSDNKIVRLSSPPEGKPLMFAHNTLDPSEVMSVTMMVYEPKNKGDDQAGVHLRAGRNHFKKEEGDMAYHISFNDGSVNKRDDIYPQGKPTQLHLVFNNSKDEVSYGKRDMAAGTVDLWVDGKLVAEELDYAKDDTEGMPLEGIGLYFYDTAGQEIYLDKVTLYDAAVEPVDE